MLNISLRSSVCPLFLYSSSTSVNAKRTIQTLQNKYSLNPMPSQLQLIAFRNFSDDKKSSDDKSHNNQSKDGYTRFQQLGQGLAGFTAFGVAIAGIYGLNIADRRNQRVDRREDLITELQLNPGQAAKTIGLTNTMLLRTRTLAQQMDMYKEASESLVIIGTSGRRMVDKKLEGHNPIPDILNKLTEKTEASVTLLIYNPNKIKDFFPNQTDQVKYKNDIEATIELAKDMNSYGDRFKVKFLDQIPPFHGDLIDNSKAHIVPLTILGMDNPMERIIETYDRQSAVLPNKFNQIKCDFRTLANRASDTPS